MSEREETSKKLKEILANLNAVSDDYYSPGYKKVKKEQLLKDFRQAVSESEALLKIFEDSYDELPDEITNIGSSIGDFFSGLKIITLTVTTNRKR